MKRNILIGLAISILLVITYWFLKKDNSSSNYHFETKKHIEHSENKEETHSSDMVKPFITKTRHKIYPVNEINKDTSLVNFINKLNVIIENKDTTQLFKIIDKKIIISWGGGIEGIKNFKTEFGFDTTVNSKFWEYLYDLVKLGGVFENDSEFGEVIKFPYLQSERFYDSINYDFEWFTTYVCIKPNVKVYSEPNLNSKVIFNLDYDILQQEDIENQYGDFVKIATLDRKIKGFVSFDDVYCTAWSSYIFKKKGKDWKLVSVAAYD